MENRESRVSTSFEVRAEDINFKFIVYNIDIALLKSNITSDNLAHDREMKDVKEALRSIAAKLDSIEQALREK